MTRSVELSDASSGGMASPLSGSTPERVRSGEASEAKCPRGICLAKKSPFCMQRKWCMPEKHGTPELDRAALEAFRSDEERR